MKSYIALGLSILFSVPVFAGDYGDGSRVGFRSRRAEIRAVKRNLGASCGCCAASESKVVEEVPAVIRKESVYRTVKVGEKVTVVPAESAATQKGK